jgi:putative methanogenesis marker protein 3
LKVSIDGIETDVQEGATVESAAAAAGIKIHEGCTIAVRKVTEMEKIQTNLYEIKTSRGRMLVRIECEGILEGWRRFYKRLVGSGVHWATREAIAFGPIVTDLEPSNEPVELMPYEITISLSGFSNENTHLIFSRKTHSSTYSPPKGCSTVGRVVYGRHLLDLLHLGDTITAMEPVLETREEEGSLTRADRTYQLKEPARISTKLALELDGSSPVCGDIVYKALGDGLLSVSTKTSRFIAHSSVSMVSLPVEKQYRRSRGSVTVRNSGYDCGSTYIYLREAALTPSHNITGKVTSGMDLADVAQESDVLAIDISPPRLDILGASQSRAAEILQEHNIRQRRSGDASDGAVVVEQSPSTTMEVYAKGEADCLGVQPSQLVRVRLYDSEAPISIRYFRRITGLDLRRTGKMTVYFATPKMDMVLFKGDEVMAKELLPENTPQAKVKPNILAVTNAVKRYAGMVGVRFSESGEFGPTAEKFEGTNIIGEVIENVDALKQVTEKKTVYISEARE